MTGLYRWYLQGRDDADEDLDLDQFDAETLGRRVLAGTPIRDLTMTALSDLLAIDPHDGSESEWIDDHEDDLQEDAVDPKAAYKEWRRGWLDEGAHQLEQEIVEAMHELLDELDEEEDEDDDSPTLKNHARELALYERTGQQDCGNAFGSDDIDIRAIRDLAKQVKGKSPTERTAAIVAVIDAIWTEEEREILAEWRKQNAADVKDAGLGLKDAFEAWKTGFRSCQIRALDGWVSDAEDE
jgi:hypothetical protein